MTVYERQAAALDAWGYILDRHRGEAPENFRNELFPRFIQMVIEAAREDEKQNQKSLKRVENVRRIIHNSKFLDDDATLYGMSIELFGYDSLTTMKSELEEYAPELLGNLIIFDRNGLGASFQLRDYDGTENTPGDEARRGDESKDEEVGANKRDNTEAKK